MRTIPTSRARMICKRFAGLALLLLGSLCIVGEREVPAFEWVQQEKELPTPGGVRQDQVVEREAMNEARLTMSAAEVIMDEPVAPPKQKPDSQVKPKPKPATKAAQPKPNTKAIEEEQRAREKALEAEEQARAAARAVEEKRQQELAVRRNSIAGAWKLSYQGYSRTWVTTITQQGESIKISYDRFPTIELTGTIRGGKMEATTTSLMGEGTMTGEVAEDGQLISIQLRTSSETVRGQMVR